MSETEFFLSCGGLVVGLKRRVVDLNPDMQLIFTFCNLPSACVMSSNRTGPEWELWA